MPIRPINVTFFFTVHSFYEYVQSNQSNTRDRRKRLQQEQTFFLQSSLFFCAFVSSSLIHCLNWKLLPNWWSIAETGTTTICSNPRSRLPKGVVNPPNKKTRKNILLATYVLSNLDYLVYIVRRLARNSQRGGEGLFWNLETTVNELDLNFYRSKQCRN